MMYFNCHCIKNTMTIEIKKQYKMLFEDDIFASGLKTPLSYPGGKSRATSFMFQYLPDNRKIKEYRESFLGGGSVAIEFTKRFPHIPIFVNDKYLNLYLFWTILQKHGCQLSNDILKIKQSLTTMEEHKELWQVQKDVLSDNSANEYDIAKAFWIVNKTAFSGLTENSTFSYQCWDEKFTIANIEKLKEYSKLIKNWVITNNDYTSLLENVGSNTFVYLDPPYEIRDSLYGKNGKMHSGFSHEEFANNVRDLKCMCMISYNSSEEIKKRFINWEHIDWDLTYTMQSTKEYGEKQRKRQELLLLNYKSSS